MSFRFNSSKNKGGRVIRPTAFILRDPGRGHSQAGILFPGGITRPELLYYNESFMYNQMGIFQAYPRINPGSISLPGGIALPGYSYPGESPPSSELHGLHVSQRPWYRL